MLHIALIFLALAAAQSLAATRRDYSNRGGDSYRAYRDDGYRGTEPQYAEPVQNNQQSNKPAYVPTYNTGYFDTPGIMYNYPGKVYSEGATYSDGTKYLQPGRTGENAQYRLQGGQNAGYVLPSTGTRYNNHDRFHPTTYEEHDDLPPMKQVPIASASQQVPLPAAFQQVPLAAPSQQVYAYQGGEAESHEGEVVESGNNVDPAIQNYQPDPNSYPPSYGYYGGSGIDTNNIHITEESKQAPAQGFTYYYLGRKLWYIPLYFSIYFVIYVAALVLKAVARHKILFPQSLQNVAAMATRSLTDDESDRILSNISEAAQKYFM